ncbi:hypothetical protein [Actinocrinis sp.]|uniref:hypothetical protein n=1 Tax=Actinocrinis sp. TaxID=1920516 RepID=UPI002CB0673B|nr:hypothetical protein [Actinocrinis sp.]HXR73198.1 hypothetical protein [Actinocrinis sp.]
MGGAFHDAVVVARCTGMAIGLGSIARYMRRDAPRAIRAFDAVVKPLIDTALAEDPELCQDTYQALLATAVRVNLALRAYTTMAGLEFDVSLSVLGGAFTRVYDDLFDHFYRADLDERLGELFRGGPFEPRSGPEALACAMFRAIVERLGRDGEDPFFAIVGRLHDFESASRRQLDPRASAADVRHITWGKGGYAVQALCALLRPGLAGSEAELVMELGHLLQLIDDHHDLATDRRDGVVTSVTLGDATLGSLATQLRGLRASLRRHYGRNRDRQLSAMLFIMLLGAYASHRRPHRPAPAAVPARATRSVWRLMFGEAGHMAPRPVDDAGA